MDCNLLPPENLKERALIEVAIALWTRNPVKDKILRVFEYRSERNLNDIANQDKVYLIFEK